MPLRLHYNENTAGASPRVLEALRRLTAEDLAFYPDYAAITARCARHFNVPDGWMLLTNGLDEGLHLVAQHAARMTAHESGPFESIVPEPAFEMYGICTDVAGGVTVRIAPAADFVFPFDAIVAAATLRTRLVYLTDPNNPTGLGIPEGMVERLADALPHATIVVDEAYADFSGRTLIGPLLDRRRNIVVGRTFAKAHGLAPLRVGALVAHPDTLAPFRAIQPPFSLNVAAITALDAALDDHEFVERRVAESRESRTRIYRFCDTHGLRYWPSEANFVLIRIGDRVADVVSAMRDRGILISNRSHQPGCAGCLRITAGVLDHTERCLTELGRVLT
jgi:histidinol-phosphate aminotransferase